MTLFSIQVRKHSIIHLNNFFFFFNENVTTNCFWFYGEMWLWNDKVKAIVHTKMKIVILYSSSRMLVTKWLVAIDFHRINKKKNTVEVSGYRQLFSYQYSSKDLLLSLREEKKKKTWGLNDDIIFIFGWTFTPPHLWHLVHAVYTWLGVRLCFVECHLGNFWTNEIVLFVTKNMILSHSQQSLGLCRDFLFFFLPLC